MFSKLIYVNLMTFDHVRFMSESHPGNLSIKPETNLLF